MQPISYRIAEIPQKFHGDHVAFYLWNAFPDQLSAGIEYPFLFSVLGVCEAEQRMNQQYNTDTHEESIEVG